MNTLMMDNGIRQKDIKNYLASMKKEIDVGKTGSMKDEPEQRIK